MWGGNYLCDNNVGRLTASFRLDIDFYEPNYYHLRFISAANPA